MKNFLAAFGILLMGWATGSEAKDSLQQDIEGVVHDMASRWANNTWPSIYEDLWDQSEPMPMYLAEEQPDWRVGQDKVREYFNPKNAGFIQAAEYQASHVQVRLIAPDLAVATWNIFWQMKYRPSPQPVAEKLRANGIFRKTEKGWKFIHYAEAPKSPSVYMQELYGDRVTPEFRKRLENKPEH